MFPKMLSANWGNALFVQLSMGKVSEGVSVDIY